MSSSRLSPQLSYVREWRPDEGHMIKRYREIAEEAAKTAADAAAKDADDTEAVAVGGA